MNPQVLSKLNPFVPNVPFLYPLKTSEKQAFLPLNRWGHFDKKIKLSKEHNIFIYVKNRLVHFQKQPPKVFYEKADIKNIAMLTGKCPEALQLY